MPKMPIRLSGAPICAWFLLALYNHPCAAQPQPERYDVVVVSGSSGGFGAALAAGRMGARVDIEDTPVLGGMLSNGISNIDTFSFESLSGIFDEFRGKVQEHYQPSFPNDPIFAPNGRGIRTTWTAGPGSRIRPGAAAVGA